MTNLPIVPVPPASKDQSATINDSVRGDGGKQTEHLPVTVEQLRKIEHTALDHTAEEAGS